MISSIIRSRIRRVSEITSIEQIARPYLLRYTRAKVFNNSSLYSLAPFNKLITNSLNREGNGRPLERYIVVLRYLYVCSTL